MDWELFDSDWSGAAEVCSEIQWQIKLSGKAELDRYLSSKEQRAKLSFGGTWRMRISISTFDHFLKKDGWDPKGKNGENLFKRLAKCRNCFICSHLWSLSPLIHLYPKSISWTFHWKHTEASLPATTAHMHCWVRKLGIINSNFCLRIWGNELAKSWQHLTGKNQTLQSPKEERKIYSKISFP